MLTLLFDGVAYGMLLFVMALGLVVTLGLMNFIHLAHGAFAMAGGYVAVAAMRSAGLPFLVVLPLAFAVAALAGLLLERTLYRPMRRRPHLDQVLFSIGLVFMAVALADRFAGSMPRHLDLPAWLAGRTEWGEGAWRLSMGHYRLFVIGVCAVLAAMLQWGWMRTRFGSRLRAAVDDPRVAAGLGIDVGRLFSVTFALGAGLAGLGGALGAEIVGIDPTFPLRCMVPFLIVVALGGTASVTGPLRAALLLGIADVAGKYFIPALGGAPVYLLMIALLMWRPRGLFAAGGQP
jgi:branched-chain amino acid transport system permease protein